MTTTLSKATRPVFGELVRLCRQIGDLSFLDRVSVVQLSTLESYERAVHAVEGSAAARLFAASSRSVNPCLKSAGPMTTGAREHSSLLTRRGLVIGAGLAAALPWSSRAAAETIHILFVCQFGAVKSPAARELLRSRIASNRRSRAGGKAVSVDARGITPGEHLSPQLRARFAAYGIDPSREPTRKLQQKNLDAADIVVLFDPLPAALHKAGVIDWTAQPSFTRDFDRAIGFLQANVGGLLERLDLPVGS